MPENLAIILAAGKGTRLDFDGPKPLFPIDETPMIRYIFNAFLQVPSIDLLTVVGHQSDKVIKNIQGISKYVYQKEQLGTGHAAAQCISEIQKYKNSFIFVADSPFISSNHIISMLRSHKDSWKC